MSDRLAKQLAKMERQYDSLRREFLADGHLSAMERQVLENVEAKLGVLRGQVERLAQRTPVAAGAAASDAQAGSTDFELVLGGPSIQRLALGPPVEGPRVGDLWALLATDGTALNRSNSKAGAHINETGLAALRGFHRLKDRQQTWLDLYDEVSTLSRRSAEGLRKMQEASSAVGKRSSNRSGAYVRRHSEAYIKGQRVVEDRMRAIGPLQEDLNKALAEMNAAGLGKQAKEGERAVKDAKQAFDEEKKNVEERKQLLGELLGLAIDAVKQDWAGLAENAVKLIGGHYVDALPTQRLDRLKVELEQATTRLVRIEDAYLLKKIEAAAAGLRGAARALEDGHRDVVDALADLKLAQKTAVEALGESRDTAAAAKMIALRSKMNALMERASSAVSAYLRQAEPLAKDLERLGGLYKGFPNILKMTPNLEPAYAKLLAETAAENLIAITEWRSYVSDIQKSGRTALRRLSDTGDGGFLEHFNRVPEVLEAAIRDR